jgi:hypothetical protein
VEEILAIFFEQQIVKKKKREKFDGPAGNAVTG